MEVPEYARRDVADPIELELRAAQASQRISARGDLHPGLTSGAAGGTAGVGSSRTASSPADGVLRAVAR